MESIVFHARKSAEDKTPVFTVRFGIEKQLGTVADTMFCVVSKPHPFLEAYCKKTGNRITDARMDHLSAEVVKGCKTVTVATKKDLAEYLPRGVAKNLFYYAKKASRYFQIDNPKILIRGTKLNWARGEWGSQANKETSFIATDIDSITPENVKDQDDSDDNT